MTFRVRVLAAILLLLGQEPLWAMFNGAAARDYALAWFDTDLLNKDADPIPDGLADHINSPLASPTTGPYTWRYWQDNRWENGTFSNNGNNTIPSGWGADCTNFVSQALKAGGIPLNGPMPGGTHEKVAQLAAVLEKISDPMDFETPSQAPPDLTVGDVVKWGHFHMTIVVSGSGPNAILAMHSTDDDGETLAGMFARARAHYPRQKIIATAYHITSDVIQGSLNVVPPTVVVKNSAGQVVPDGGAVGQNISVEVTGSGEGIAALEVTRGERLLDRAQEVFDGSGEFIFVDPSPKGQSFTYNVDLSAVPEGERIYVQAVDGSGGISVVSFTIDRAPARPGRAPRPGSSRRGEHGRW